MQFKDVVGQGEVKQRLIRDIRENRIAHAQLFVGNEGVGALPLALAYARYVMCSNRQEHDSCGVCPSCVKFDKLSHPDLHFVFPVVKNAKKKKELCDDYIQEWRDFVISSPYFTTDQWNNELGAENSQPIIYAKESDEIIKKLSLKSTEGGYKCTIIWLPEKMHISCANKLLKLLEEPPKNTLFLLVSQQPEQIIQTIISRTQRINIGRIAEKGIYDVLRNKYSLGENDSQHIARVACGSFVKALEQIHINKDEELFFEMFVSLMRLSYLRKIKEMKEWSEKVAGWGREKQKSFIDYCQRMIRENFVYNFMNKDLNYMNEREKSFAVKFAPFVNENNIIGLMDELSEAQIHIEQNVNAKMVFFDFALKMIVLIKNR